MGATMGATMHVKAQRGAFGPGRRAQRSVLNTGYQLLKQATVQILSLQGVNTVMSEQQRTPAETLKLLEDLDLERLPMPTGLTPEMLPHEALRHIGMTDGLEIDDVVFDRGLGQWVRAVRIFSVKERLDALKAASAFYAASLKAVEATVKGDLSGQSVEELQKKAEQLLGKLKSQ